jgi:hypothetical protein
MRVTSWAAGMSSKGLQRHTWLKRLIRAVAASGGGGSEGRLSDTSSSDLISSMAAATEVDGSLSPEVKNKRAPSENC